MRAIHRLKGHLAHPRHSGVTSLQGMLDRACQKPWVCHPSKPPGITTHPSRPSNVPPLLLPCWIRDFATLESPFTLNRTWAFADNSHLWCPSDSPCWHLAGEVQCVRMYVPLCVCLFQWVSVQQGKGTEVTRVVVQMSAQLAEPHEWRLLWWWRGNALEAWPTHSSHLNGWNSTWSKRQAHACRLETMCPLYDFFFCLSVTVTRSSLLLIILPL